MDILQETDLKELIDTSSEWCISMYLPTHKAGREQQQDPIRLKNLIQQAEEVLLEKDINRMEMRTLLKPAQDLLVDNDFWQHQSLGLAIFLAPGFSRIYRVPMRFEELMLVGNTFQIKPLLPLFESNGRFYLLTLSMNNVQFYSVTANTIAELDTGDIPTSMQEALWMDDPEKHLDFHTSAGSPGRYGERQAMFHGHGVVEADEKKNILRYFQKVDKGLIDLIGGQNIPLVIAGVGYLLPIYREANTYPALFEEGIEGNPDDRQLRETHRLAWNLMEPQFSLSQKEAAARFEKLNGQGSELAAGELNEIVRSAYFGRVDTLFVPRGVRTWGWFDPEKNKVFLEESKKKNNYDLLDFAATHTLINSGRVYALPAREMPAGCDEAAILRYAT